MIHIVFQQNDEEVLQKAFALDSFLQGDVIRITDDLAIGPLTEIYEQQGIEARRDWWRGIWAAGEDTGTGDKYQAPDDRATVAALIERLRIQPEENCWIWAAQNEHDVSGYYWLMSQLKEFQGRIFILYLNNLPFINEKGLIFYPLNLFEIPAREFLKARKLARPITLSEFETDPDEWTKLCNEGKGLRILEGGKKLSQQDYPFYDAEFKRFITGDWIKVGKLIHQFQVKAKRTTGDAFLLWRLKELVAAGEIEVQGAGKSMKDLEVKSKAMQGAPSPVS